MKKELKDETWADLRIFTLKGRKIKHPGITIIDNSSFLFNSALGHRANLKTNTYVVLGYSRTNKAIIFQFTADSQALGAHTIVHRFGSSSTQSKTFFYDNLLNVSDLVGHYIPEKIRIPKIGEVWAIYLEKKQPKK